MRKDILPILMGVALMIAGSIVESQWRQNPKYRNYDNAGPGYYLGVPGFITLIVGIRKCFKNRRQHK